MLRKLKNVHVVRRRAGGRSPSLRFGALTVFLEKVVWAHALSEFVLPEHQCFLQAQPNALEEEAILHAPGVAEVVVGAQPALQMLHTHGE